MLPLYDDLPTRRFPWMTILVILTNLAVFVWWQVGTDLDESVKLWGLVPAAYFHSSLKVGLEHVFSSMFMHGGWGHLIGNMWFLWIFGNNVEDSTGGIRFLIFYLLCGAAAAYAFMMFSPQSGIPMVGASGAISGVLGAYLVLHPGAQITTLGFWLVPIKLSAWFFLFYWIALQFLLQVTDGEGGIAYLAHIGGFFAGLILIFFFNNHVDSLGSET